MPACWQDGTEFGGGDGGDGILGRGDWKKFQHARASGARRIMKCRASVSLISVGVHGIFYFHLLVCFNITNIVVIIKREKQQQ